MGAAGTQRVVVKARFVRMKGAKGVKGLRVHLSYLERTGTGLESDRPQFFSRDAGCTRADLSKLVGSWEKDPHHFRFILSPERAGDLELNEYTKSVMREVERALGTRLEWFAVSHHNTDNPHVHITVRGVDDTGKPLFIEPDFIKHGFRLLAEKEATRLLGPRLEADRSAALDRDLLAARWTWVDREIDRLSQSGSVPLTLPVLGSNAPNRDRKHKERLLKRLHYLSTIGLAQEKDDAAWSVGSEFEASLRAYAKRSGVISEISKFLSDEDKSRAVRVYQSGDEILTPVVGEIVYRGVANELMDAPYIVIRGEEGAIHYLPLGQFGEQRGFMAAPGAIVSVVSQKPSYIVDKHLVNISSRSGGLVAESSILEILTRTLGLDRGAEAAERYKARIESLTSLGLIKEQESGVLRVPQDLVAQVIALEQTLKFKPNRFRVATLSHISLHDQVIDQGPTWLDALLENRDSGRAVGSAFAFGAKVLWLTRSDLHFTLLRGRQS
jgi:type IV secretory pathway VirD2 relaxase